MHPLPWLNPHCSSPSAHSVLVPTLLISTLSSNPHWKKYGTKSITKSLMILHWWQILHWSTDEFGRVVVKRKLQVNVAKNKILQCSRHGTRVEWTWDCSRTIGGSLMLQSTWFRMSRRMEELKQLWYKEKEALYGVRCFELSAEKQRIRPWCKKVHAWKQSHHRKQSRSQESQQNKFHSARL